MFKRLREGKRQSGFTIIEVMIVLAIAGLIMLVVLVVVPQLQRNSRDSRRDALINRLNTEMETYAGSNSGKYPVATGCATSGCWSDFYNRYVNNGTTALIDLNDPSGISVVNANPSTACSATNAFAICDYAANVTLPNTNPGDLAIVRGAKCDGENVQASGATGNNARTLAIIIRKDRTGTYSCVDKG